MSPRHALVAFAPCVLAACTLVLAAPGCAFGAAGDDTSVVGGDGGGPPPLDGSAGQDSTQPDGYIGLYDTWVDPGDTSPPFDSAPPNDGFVPPFDGAATDANNPNFCPNATKYQTEWGAAFTGNGDAGGSGAPCPNNAACATTECCAASPGFPWPNLCVGQ
jgi:hypothetical protein